MEVYGNVGLFLFFATSPRPILKIGFAPLKKDGATMTYLVYEGISYWESTFVSDDSDAVEWLKAEFTNLRSAKQYVKLWAYAKKAQLYCNGMLAQIEYNEHPERMWEEDVQELTREWCRIEKKE